MSGSSLSVGFSRQEYWSGLAFPSPGDLPDPGSNLGLLRLLHWQADFFTPEPPGKPFTSEEIDIRKGDWQVLLSDLSKVVQAESG